MTTETEDQVIVVDDVEYKLSEISDSAKTQLINIQFVDAQLQQLNNELAVADTARIGYTRALDRELKQLDQKDQS